MAYRCLHSLSIVPCFSLLDYSSSTHETNRNQGEQNRFQTRRGRTYVGGSIERRCHQSCLWGRILCFLGDFQIILNFFPCSFILLLLFLFCLSGSCFVYINKTDHDPLAPLRRRLRRRACCEKCSDFVTKSTSRVRSVCRRWKFFFSKF